MQGEGGGSTIGGGRDRLFGGERWAGRRHGGWRRRRADDGSASRAAATLPTPHPHPRACPLTVHNLGSINVDHVLPRAAPRASGGRRSRAARSRRCSAARGPTSRSRSPAPAPASATSAASARRTTGRDVRWRKPASTCRRSASSTGRADTRSSRWTTPARTRSSCTAGPTTRSIARRSTRPWPPAAAGELLLLQNETSGIAEAFDAARERGLRIAFNPAPMHASLAALPLERCDTLILNETEAAMLAAADPGTAEPEAKDSETVDADALEAALATRYPDVRLVLTLGARGRAPRARGRARRRARRRRRRRRHDWGGRHVRRLPAGRARGGRGRTHGARARLHGGGAVGHAARGAHARRSPRPRAVDAFPNA